MNCRQVTQTFGLLTLLLWPGPAVASSSNSSLVTVVMPFQSRIYASPLATFVFEPENSVASTTIELCIETTSDDNFTLDISVEIGDSSKLGFMYLTHSNESDEAVLVMYVNNNFAPAWNEFALESMLLSAVQSGGYSNQWSSCNGSYDSTGNNIEIDVIASLNDVIEGNYSATMTIMVDQI